MRQREMLSGTAWSRVCIHAKLCHIRSFKSLQTIANVFALCGPLKLPPRAAVVADECYNGGFMVGRFLSMFVVDRVSPRRMLKWSSVACLCAATAVALKADESAAVLYACALVFGFAISWQFGAAYSWASEHIDVVVRHEYSNRLERRHTQLKATK